MDSHALQQAINEDIKQLKHLKIEIIPAKIYYRGLLRLSFCAFWKIGFVFLLTTAYVYLTYTNPHAVMNSMYSGVVRGATIHGAQIKDVLLITSGIMGVVTLVLTPSLNSYFLIQYHLKNQLQTGDYLVKKLQGAGWLFWASFSILSILFAIGSEPGVIVICEVLSLVLSALVTFFVMSLEFNRLGLSVLYQVIGTWLNKDTVPAS